MGICCDFKRKDPQSENIRCKTEPDQEEHSQFLAYPKPKSKLALNRPFTDINVSTQRQKIKHNSLTQIQAPYNQNRNNQNNTLKDKKRKQVILTDKKFKDLARNQLQLKVGAIQLSRRKQLGDIDSNIFYK